MAVRRPTPSQMREVADDLGMELGDGEIDAFVELARGALGAFDLLDLLPDYLPPVKYPRTPGYRPEGEENKYGAWYVKTSIKGPQRGKLAGKKVAIKDTVCVAGVPLTDGASTLEGYVPEVDATIVTRILDAGGEIAGKAVCEYFSYSGGSHTAVTGLVHNPRKHGYSAGGSSSGSAALVAAGEVEMAIGGDQAGSIRIPAALCGIYGMKQTYGLVPYTGILSSVFHVDHAGPMTATVADNALLLEVIAGEDGIDPRQRAVRPAKYTEALKKSANGLKIALVKEGFEPQQNFSQEGCEPDVTEKVQAAAAHFRSLGAEVDEVSIPIHAQSAAIWMGFAMEGYLNNMLKGNALGLSHGGLYVTSLNDKLSGWKQRSTEFPPNLKLGMLLGQYMSRHYNGHAMEFPPNLKLGMLLGQYMSRHYNGHYYAKAINLTRRMRAAYDDMLAEYDLLMMPTVYKPGESEARDLAGAADAPARSTGRRRRSRRVAPRCRRRGGNCGEIGTLWGTDLTHHPANAECVGTKRGDRFAAPLGLAGLYSAAWPCVDHGMSDSPTS